LDLVYPNKRTTNEIIEFTSGVVLTCSDEYVQRSVGEPAGILVYGDNLRVLKTLLDDPKIIGKVQLIYIDPPFATDQVFSISEDRVSTISRANGGDLAYSDKLNGYAYLEFIRERLILLRELLSDTGSIYLHIDDKIGHYVKIIMDEVFGSRNFINDITRVKCNPKNFDRKAYGNIKDTILFYSKTNDYTWNGSKEPYTDDDIERLFSKVDDEGRHYTTTPLHAPGETENGATGQEWRGLKPPVGRHWRVPPDELEKLEEQGLIEWSKTGNPRKIIFANDRVAEGKKRQDIWEFKDPMYPDYPTEKNVELLKTIIKTSSNEGDIVLDCFAGSGTTLIAADELGRRWIGVDKSDFAIKTCISRILNGNPLYNFVFKIMEGYDERMDREKHTVSEGERLFR